MLVAARVRIVLVLVVGLVVQACASAPATPQAQSSASASAQPSASASAPSSAELTTVKVATTPYITSAPFFIAQDEGYFAEQGLRVEFVNFTSANEIIPAVATGQVDVAAGLLSAGIFNTIAKGGEIRIVADKGYIDPQSCPNIGLMARQDLATTGTTMTADQLRGLKVAHFRGSWLDYYATKLLGTVDLTLEDLEVVSMPPASIMEAMSSKQVDLVLNSEPWITRLQQAGHVSILTPVQELLPDSQSAVTIYGASLLNNPDVGNRFMVAYLQAVRQYNEGKTDTNVATLATAIQLDPELIKAMCWPTLRADGALNTASVEDFQNWGVAAKLIDQSVTEAQYWNGSFVEYANTQLGAASR